MDYIWHEMRECAFLRKLPQYAPYITRLICLKWEQACRGDFLEQCYPITIHKERSPNFKNHALPRYGKNAPKDPEEEEADSDDSDFVPNSVKTKYLFAKLTARSEDNITPPSEWKSKHTWSSSEESIPERVVRPSPPHGKGHVQDEEEIEEEDEDEHMYGYDEDEDAEEDEEEEDEDEDDE
nr:uncharacterized protein LOC127316039 [Lolium perenne]